MAHRAPLVVTIFLQLLVAYTGHLPPTPDIPSTYYSSNGTADFTLGALLPVHTYLCLSGACTQAFSGFSLLQRMEAITYAVEEINARNDLLQGFTLGYVIYDDQDSTSTALAQGLRFVQLQQWSNTTLEGGDPLEEEGRCSGGGTMATVPTMEKHSVVGVIASEASLTTLQVATLFTPFRLPQISYLATSSSLSSRQKYPFFFRTIPSGESQAQAIIGLMRHYNWKYASVIFSEGQYGTSGYRDLLKSAEDVRRVDSGYRMCFGIAREIDDSWTVRQYKDLIYELLLERYATTVVAYISLAHARILLALAEGMAIERKLTWIATDAWLNELDDLSESAKAKLVGALSVKAKSVNPPRFYRRFRQLTPASSHNPWLPRFLEVNFNCSYPPGANPAYSPCKADLNISRDGRNPREKTVSLVYDAVYAFAHALQDALDLPSCKLQGKERRRKCAISHLPETLRSVRFQGETGEVKFDGKTLSVSRAYSLYNLQDRSGQWSLVDVGSYDRGTGGLTIDSEHIQWSNGTIPSTKCNERCEIGYGQRVTEQCCCWMCEKCPKHHIVIFLTAEGRWQCQACPKGMWPDPSTRRSCDVIKPTYVKWNEPLGIIISSLAATGLAACIVTFVLYLMNNSHPLVKASSRELSYFLLVSIGICYSFCFFFIVRPSSKLCVVRQFGISVCFTLLYGPLVIKTSRIYRICEASSKNRRPCCVASKSQLGIAVLLVVIQCSIIIGFLFAKPPVVEERAEEGVNRVDQTCSSDERAYITSFTFNGLLLVAAMYCAFKTRKLPDHFNEARFMTFCVYSTLIIWLTFIPVYFIVRTALHQILLLSLGVLVNATLVLICFFGPKLVAVYLVDQPGDDAPTDRFRTKRRHHRKSFHRSWSKSSDVHPITPPEIVEQTTLAAIGEMRREHSVNMAQSVVPVVLVSVAGNSASSTSDQSELGMVEASDGDTTHVKMDDAKDKSPKEVLEDNAVGGTQIIASEKEVEEISKSGSGSIDTSLREENGNEKLKST